MAMTTMPSGLSLLRAESAFRSVLPSYSGPFNDPSSGLVPVNSDLIPPALLQGFSIPRLDFDQAYASGYGSGVGAPFMRPLPFLGDSSGARLGASSARENPATSQPPETSLAPIYTGAVPATSEGHALPEDLPMSAILDEQAQGCLDDSKPMHRPRVVWSEELHQRFLRAIDAAGSDEAAVPTVILKLMNVSGLSRDNVASHLQKHRLGLKRGKSRKRRAPTATMSKSKQVKAVESCTDQLHHPDADAGTVNTSNAGANAAEDGPSAHRAHIASEQASKGENAGSNERDDCDDDGRSSDDGAAAGSDDGAGAGSDNRNSACNVSTAELHVQPTSSAPEARQAGVDTAGNQAAGVGEAGLANLEDHVAKATAQREGSGGSRGARSPDASRSGSNNAGNKQVGNSNGVSDVHGSPTAGSRTGLDAQQYLQVTGARSCVPGAPRECPVRGAMAGAIFHKGAGPFAMSESSKSPHAGIQRTGSTPPDMVAVPPISVPMSLPVPPQVPAANAEPMRAPRLGDE